MLGVILSPITEKLDKGMILKKKIVQADSKIYIQFLPLFVGGNLIKTIKIPFILSLGEKLQRSLEFVASRVTKAIEAATNVKKLKLILGNKWKVGIWKRVKSKCVECLNASLAPFIHTRRQVPGCLCHVTRGHALLANPFFEVFGSQCSSHLVSYYRIPNPLFSVADK